MSKSKEKQHSIDDFTEFHVTGVDRNGKRFKSVYSATPAGYMRASGTNLWNGHVWGIRKDTGRRIMLKSVVN